MPTFTASLFVPRRSALIALLACLVAAAFARADEPAGVRVFLKTYCYDCHDDATKKQGLNIEALEFNLNDSASFDRWAKLFDRVKAGQMPPPKEEQPPAAERAAFATHLHDALLAHNRKRQETQGRTILRRLNRVEWENTVHDLLAIEVPLKHLLPEDTPLHGFDTVADGLRLSQLHMESYLEAADVAIDAAIDLSPPPAKLSKRYTYKEEKGIRDNLDTPEGTIRDQASKEKHHIIFRELPDAVVLYSDSYSPTDLKQFRPPAAGRYRFRLSAYGFNTAGRHVTARVYASDYRNERLVTYLDFPPDKPREAEFTAWLAHDEHLRIVPYDTGFDKQGKSIWNVSGPKFEGGGLAVQWIELEGPLTESWPPPSVKSLFGDVPVVELAKNKQGWRRGKRLAYELTPQNPRTAITTIIERFAARAFRRPLTGGEADGFIALATKSLEAGQDLDGSLRIAFRAILTAPQFLLLEEHPGKLDDDALASRLSYFLWSTLPDDALLKAAAEKKLSQPAALREQVERMLKSPRAVAFTTNFVGQWLDLRRIDATSPDTRLYPEFDEILRQAMIGETEAFFNELLREDLSVANLISCDFVTVNRRIAEHYGLQGVTGESFQRVKLPEGSPRGGILTQASVLKVTANGTVTSPVTRGSWVLERLLGDPPPPPPPGVGSVEPDTRGATTIRQQLDKHRNVESCAGCHRKIDPPGFALESFDVIGGFRERYRSKEKGDRPTYKLKGRDIHEYKLGLRIDASGTLPDGRAFADIRQFKQLLLTQKEQIAGNLATKLLVYATGAGAQFADREAIDAIMKESSKTDYGLRSLVHAIVQSPTFQHK